MFRLCQCLGLGEPSGCEPIPVPATWPTTLVPQTIIHYNRLVFEFLFCNTLTAQMPELPEVETMRRGIEHVRGARVLFARRTRCRKKPILTRPAWPTIARRIVRQIVSSVERLGKRLLIRFENGETLVIEPRMSGLVLTGSPPSWEHLRWELGVNDAVSSIIRFWDRRGLGQISLLSEAELDEFLKSGRVGQDALEISAQELQDSLSKRRVAVKVGLLDQSAVAGIGNIYASEILHLARIHPQRQCCEISRSGWRRIHGQMIRVLQTAIEFEGSTLSDGTYRNALNEAGSYQHAHRVYDRDGLRCTSCGKGRIKRMVQSQRSSYFCPRCQRATRA